VRNSTRSVFKKSIALSCLLSTLLAGCATDVANRYYATEKYPPKKPKEVELLWKNPQRPYVVIADFQARGESPEGMRKWAAEIGADVVIVSTLGGYYDRNTVWAGQDKEANSYSRITGTAIRYQTHQTIITQ
jgi:hypothetical protein